MNRYIIMLLPVLPVLLVVGCSFLLDMESERQKSCLYRQEQKIAEEIGQSEEEWGTNKIKDRLKEAYKRCEAPINKSKIEDKAKEIPLFVCFMKETKTLEETISDKPASYPDRETIKKEIEGVREACKVPPSEQLEESIEDMTERFYERAQSEAGNNSCRKPLIEALAADLNINPKKYSNRETIKNEILGIYKTCKIPNPTGQEEVEMKRFITVLHETAKALLKTTP